MRSNSTWVEFHGDFTCCTVPVVSFSREARINSMSLTRKLPWAICRGTCSQCTCPLASPWEHQKSEIRESCILCRLKDPQSPNLVPSLHRILTIFPSRPTAERSCIPARIFFTEPVHESEEMENFSILSLVCHAMCCAQEHIWTNVSALMLMLMPVQSVQMCRPRLRQGPSRVRSCPFLMRLVVSLPVRACP